MALAVLTPAIARSRDMIAQNSSKVALKLLPDISAGKQADRKFFAIFVSFVGIGGLLFLLFINTILAQDAFVLTHLKLQAKMVSDQREAIAREIDRQSSPESLSKKALALGMKPSQTPTFLNLDKPADQTESARNG